MANTEKSLWERDIYHTSKISDTALLKMRMKFLITVTIIQSTHCQSIAATLNSQMALYHNIWRGYC